MAASSLKRRHEGALPSRRHSLPGPLLFYVVIFLLAVKAAIPLVTAAQHPSGSQAGSAELSRSFTRERLSGHEVDGSSVDDAIEELISTVRTWQENPLTAKHGQRGESGRHGLPFVTLAYAQSLDGFIALLEDEPDVEEEAGLVERRGRLRSERTSSNLPLSCQSSLRMTHALRSVHDAILIGGATLEVDNPRLNVRLWPPADKNEAGEKGSTREFQTHPRPVVLDTDLRHLSSFIKAGNSIRAQDLIVCCAKDAAENLQGDLPFDVEILPCCRDPSGIGLDLRDVLRRLRDLLDIHSIMVEGGATVLSSFATRGLADCLCVTVTPNLIGGLRGVCAFGTYDASCDIADDKRMPLKLDGEGARLVAAIGSDYVFLAPWPQ